MYTKRYSCIVVVQVKQAGSAFEVKTRGKESISTDLLDGLGVGSESALKRSIELLDELHLLEVS